MKKILMILGVLVLLSNTSFPQSSICGYKQPKYDSMEEQRIKDYVSNLGTNRTTNVITVPVVFHVVWQTGYPQQNVSDAQIMSQLDALNRDFNLLNTDAANTPSIFTPTNSNIQFCLATKDPNGNATSGIIRRETSVSGWNPGNLIGYYNLGGSESWSLPGDPACQYLNIYVCNLNGSVIGVSAVGIIAVDYAYFGTIGTLSSSYNKGRDAVHEVGHWLNLRHIWGDANCGDDLVSDTPPAQTSNFGCPTFPYKLGVCSGNTTGEMTMNYMDYTNDGCKTMFSQGQVDRMRACLTPTGTKSGILTSLGCTPPTYTSCVINNLGVTVPEIGKFRVAWTPVPGATSYTLQYSTLYGFQVATQITVTSTDTLIIPIPTSVNTCCPNLYYVRVKANCSSLSNFTPQIKIEVDKNVGVNMLDPILTGGTSTGGGGTTIQCIDNNEPNNTLISPKPIAVNTNIFGAISTSTDVDCFSFSTTKQQKNVQIVLSNLTANYTLSLYNSSGTLLATSSNAGTSNEIIIANNLLQASYKIKISIADSTYDPTSCYNLIVNRSRSSFRVINSDGTYYEDFDSELIETKIYTITGSLVDVKNIDELSNGIYIIYYIYKDKIEFEKIIK